MKCKDVYINIKENCIPNEIVHVLCAISKLSKLFLKNNTIILKHIAWESNKNGIRILVVPVGLELFLKSGIIFRAVARLAVTGGHFFFQILINFSYFSSNFTYFLPNLGPRLAHPGRPWLRHLINNSRIAWPTKTLVPFFNFSENLLQDAYTIFFFKKSWSFWSVFKIYLIEVWGADPSWKKKRTSNN